MQVEKYIKKERISPVKKKITEFVMPTKENYVTVLAQNYTIKQLKEIIAHYKIKLGGASVKAELMSKICDHFQLYDCAFIIQKAWRRYLFKQYNRLRGPARFNRKICVNDTDFFTMDSLHDLPYNQFFSFTDIDNMVYGFDIMSIYNLLYKDASAAGSNASAAGSNASAAGSSAVKNPYNRNSFPKQVTKVLMKIIRLSKIFNDTINLDMNEGEEKNPLVEFETRLMALFSDMDHLGNYTNYNWFLSLNHTQLIRFLSEIQDIWSYRANLTEATKREICLHHRDLFQKMHMIDLRLTNVPILREIAIDIMNNLVRDGINRDSRSLGTNLVLCALTLVSYDAAEAMPWFYQSVM